MDEAPDEQSGNVDEGLDGQFRLVGADGETWLIRLQNRRIEEKDVDELLPHGDDIFDGAIDSLEATVSLTTLGVPRSLDDTRALAREVKLQADRLLGGHSCLGIPVTLINTVESKLIAERSALQAASLPGA